MFMLFLNINRLSAAYGTFDQVSTQPQFFKTRLDAFIKYDETL